MLATGENEHLCEVEQRPSAQIERVRALDQCHCLARQLLGFAIVPLAREHLGARPPAHVFDQMSSAAELCSARRASSSASSRRPWPYSALAM